MTDQSKHIRAQKLLKSLQKDPKSVCYLVSNISKTALNKARKSSYEKDNVFVKT